VSRPAPAPLAPPEIGIDRPHAAFYDDSAAGGTEAGQGNAMPTFDERERGFEAKFAHDEELRFLLTARRDKLLAHWAAARLKLTAEAEAALVAEVLAIAGPPGPDGHDAAVLTRIAEMMAAHHAAPGVTDLTAALRGCAEQAREQVLAAPPEA
jgi:hypothetical protein